MYAYVCDGKYARMCVCLGACMCMCVCVYMRVCVCLVIKHLVMQCNLIILTLTLFEDSLVRLTIIQPLYFIYIVNETFTLLD